MILVLTLITIGILMTHSLYILLSKYVGKEPSWLKAYVFFYIAYAVLTVIISWQYLTDIFSLSSGFAAYGMGITLFILLFVAIKIFTFQKSNT